MHSSKGLEFERVFIPALGSIPSPYDDQVAEAKLLYVAMTRATELLVMTHSDSSAFTDQVAAALEAISMGEVAA